MSRAGGKWQDLRPPDNCTGESDAGESKQGRQKSVEGKLTSDRPYGLPANVICNYNQIPLIPLQVSADASSLRKADPKGRSALLADIQQGTRLRKVTQINDRSAPQIEGK